MSALCTEKGLWQTGVHEEFLAIAAWLLGELKPLADSLREVVLHCVVATLGAVAVPPMLTTDVAELFSAVATNNGSIVSVLFCSQFGPEAIDTYVM